MPRRPTPTASQPPQPTSAIHIDPLRAPPLSRRMLCMLYEGVILFGIIFLAALVFGLALQQRNGLQHREALTAWIGVIVGLYFIWCWSHGGQTLPMKTWKMRAVTASGTPLEPWRAVLRFFASWLWWLPPLLLHPLLHLSIPHTLIALAIWTTAWATAERLDPQRQFLHDRLVGTRLVPVTPSAPSPSSFPADAPTVPTSTHAPT